MTVSLHHYLKIVALFMLLFASKAQAQIITTVAGNGTYGNSGNGGPADSAELDNPWGLAVDAAKDIYITDNNTIRKINTRGIITRVAGDGSTVIGPGSGRYSGDGGPATSAELNDPNWVAVDAVGNIYIVDLYNGRIRKVDTNGIISTVAGNGTVGYTGDGGPATSAEFNNPFGIAVDAFGNIYIADEYNNVIRKVNTSGIINTVAGNGTAGYSGDGGPASSAELKCPTGVAVDTFGNIYIADMCNERIRKVNTSGVISTVAGDGYGAAIGFGGYSGDGGAATSAELNTPTSVAVDNVGNIYIADLDNNRIRKVNTSGIISTIAGNGTKGYGGDGMVATSAELNSPIGVAVDAAGNIYISDNENFRIRKVTAGNLPVTIASFTATAKNKTVATNWQTATELNTSHFNIQRSTDGSSFANIGTVKAVGSGANSYSFVDLAPSPSPIASGKLNYRLQSVDKDGSTSYSKTVAVSLTNFDPRLSAISIYPNPVKDILTIGGNHIASVQVIDNLGRVVKVVSLNNVTNPTIHVDGLAQGVYYLRIATTDGKVSGLGFVKK